MSETEITNGLRWSAPPEDRTYQPPVEPEPFEAPRVTAPASAVDGTVLEQAYNAQLHANKSLAKHVEATNANKHLYSQEGYRDQIAKFNDTDAAKAVDKSAEQVRARVDQAAADVEKFRRNLTQPGDAAQESRSTRFWARTKPLLDKADQNGAALALAEDLLAKATREEVSVLVEELGPYFDARGLKLERVNRSTGAKVDLLDETIARVFPEYATARTKLNKAKQAARLVEQGATYLRQGFQTGQAVNVGVLQKLNPAGLYDPDK
jgi:hypothetical protein